MIEPPPAIAAAEPLAASAPVAWHLAGSACTNGCAAYHGLVQYLRLLGVVAAPDRHARFYGEALRAVAAAGGTRVLVAGAADYGMAAQVLAAFAAAGAGAPHITLIDRCPTPLLLNRWFCAERGVELEAVVADAERFVPVEPVDAVVTDSLLTLLGAAGRERAFAAWRASLRPGGRVVTTLRIARGSRPSGPEATGAFVRWVLERAEAIGGMPDLGPAELEAAARRYAGAPIALAPVTSADEFAAAVERAGLRVERLETLDVPGNAPRDAAAPGIHRAERYARLVAVRP